MIILVPSADASCRALQASIAAAQHCRKDSSASTVNDIGLIKVWQSYNAKNCTLAIQHMQLLTKQYCGTCKT